MALDEKSIEAFFVRYAEGANTFDPDTVTSEFAPVFMSADPNGAVCIHNDEEFRAAIPQRKEFFKQIGFRSATILSLAPTLLDERYAMVKVEWRMIFRKEEETPREFTFFITYFLFDNGNGAKVVFYISHDDETRTMREAGLIPWDGE